jgi:hypothetical protein
MKLFNFIALLCLGFLIANSVAYAYVPIELHNGIKYKFYDSTINKQGIYDTFDEFSLYTRKGMVIRVFKQYSSDRYCGLYHVGANMIDLYCHDKDTIIHEIAHSIQMENKSEWKRELWHDETFDKIKEKIKRNEK